MRTDLDPLAVDQHAALGVGIRNGPAAIVIPGQDRVVAGNCGKIDANIAGFTAADDVFPVR